jgi:uncharacterized protein YbcC (UPF0753/DUF2309 family)
METQQPRSHVHAVEVEFGGIRMSLNDFRHYLRRIKSATITIGIGGLFGVPDQFMETAICHSER